MITDIQKRKRAIENYLHKADVRKWSQFNKPSSTDYEIVHCTVYLLNNNNNDCRIYIYIISIFFTRLQS